MNGKTTAGSKILIFALTAATCGFGCVPQEQDAQDTQDTQDAAETEQFRQGLVKADDVQMDYDARGTQAQALNGDYSMIAGLTGQAVVGTNTFLGGHFAMLEAVTALPPSESGEDYRVWEGDHDGLTLRLSAERSLVPRGTRFDYRLEARPADDESVDMLNIFDGWVVRVETRPEEFGRQGFGVVRYHFDHLNTLEPHRDIDGKARIAFRKVGNVHQIHVRDIGIKTPDHPDFPPAAEYRYTLLPDESGSMRWYSLADVKKDGEPLEHAAVHSRWRADKSGFGSALVTGGSLDVDYWHLVECWDRTFIKGYEMFAAPQFEQESGEVSSCFGTPQDLELPVVLETLPDEDPEVPAAHPEEQAE